MIKHLPAEENSRKPGFTSANIDVNPGLLGTYVTALLFLTFFGVCEPSIQID